jgi:hypothetical protein
VTETWIKKDFLVKVYLNTIGHFIHIKAVTFVCQRVLGTLVCRNNF